MMMEKEKYQMQLEGSGDVSHDDSRSSVMKGSHGSRRDVGETPAQELSEIDMRTLDGP